MSMRVAAHDIQGLTKGNAILKGDFQDKLCVDDVSTGVGIEANEDGTSKGDATMRADDAVTLRRPVASPRRRGDSPVMSEMLTGSVATAAPNSSR